MIENACRENSNDVHGYLCACAGGAANSGTAMIEFFCVAMIQTVSEYFECCVEIVIIY